MHILFHEQAVYEKNTKMVKVLFDVVGQYNGQKRRQCLRCFRNRGKQCLYCAKNRDKRGQDGFLNSPMILSMKPHCKHAHFSRNNYHQYTNELPKMNSCKGEVCNYLKYISASFNFFKFS